MRGRDIGSYIAAWLDSRDIPRKAVCSQLRMDQATMSRKINGERDFQEEEIFRIGFAAGEISGKDQARREVATMNQAVTTTRA